MAVCAKLHSAEFFVGFLCVFIVHISVIKQVSGQPEDVRLTCPDTWTEGQMATLICEVNKTSITNKCVTAPQSTDFLRGGVSQCAVGPTDYASCTYTVSGTPGCGCQENSTYYVFILEMIVDPALHDKVWTCVKSCQDLTGLLNPLVQTSSPTCSNPNIATTTTTSPTTQESTSAATTAPPTTPQVPGPYCRDCERPLCPSEWVSALIIFGLFRLFAIVYFVLYVLFAADKTLWPFNRILADWEIFLMCLATAFFPECVVLCIIDAILWRPCCCLDCISVPWRILLLVLAVVICLASIIYMIVAGIVQLWPFPEISIEECPNFECVHEGWQIFLFVVSCIGIAILICFLIAFCCKNPPPRGPELFPEPLPGLLFQPPGKKMFYKLLVKCGECNKWYLFSVTLDDKKLQNIFIKENLNEIFKKCASHGQKEFSLKTVEQIIQEIHTKWRMGDIRNVTLHQTICLKDLSRDKWYKQDHEPDKAVLDAVMEGQWRWSEGAGTAVDPEGLKDVLQIRLYLQSNSNPYANQ